MRYLIGLNLKKKIYGSNGNSKCDIIGLKLKKKIYGSNGNVKWDIELI